MSVSALRTASVAPSDTAVTVPSGTTATSEDAIRVAVRRAAGLGVPGIFNPGLDEAGMTAIWITMVTTIAKRQGASVSPATAAKLVTSALSSVAAYTLGSKILTWGLLLVLHALPIAAVPAAVAMNVALNATFTYKLGKECDRRFSDPKFTTQDLVNFGRQLVMVPTLTEIAEIRHMLTGR